TRGHRLQFFLHPFHCGLLHYVGRTLHSCGDIFGKRWSPFILSRPCSLLLRLARAISTTRNFTLLVRLRNFVPTAPVISLILFISRVSTRTISHQTAIGRIVNVGLHHGGVHSQFAARDDLFGLCVASSR